MSNDSISGPGGPSAPMTPSELKEAAKKIIQQQIYDTMDISGMPAGALVMEPNAANPALGISGITGSSSSISSVDTFVMSVQLKKDKIVSEILDQWLQGIRAAAERIKEYLNSPDYLAWQQTQTVSYIADSNAKTSASMEHAILTSSSFLAMNPKTAINAINGLEKGVTEFVNKYKQGDGEAMAWAPFVVSSLVLGASFVGNAVTAATSAAHVTPANPVIQVSPLEQMIALSPTMAAELGLLGAMLMRGVLFYSNLESAKGEPANGQPKVTPEFAKNYANNIQTLVSSATFNSFVRNAAIVNLSKNEIANNRQDQLVNNVKVIFLASALAIVYGARHGHITGKEFSDMLDGKLVLPQAPANDPNSKAFADYNQMNALISQINSLLAVPDNITGTNASALAAERGRLKSAISEYLDKHSDPDQLAERDSFLTGVASGLQSVPVSQQTA